MGIYSNTVYGEIIDKNKPLELLIFRLMQLKADDIKTLNEVAEFALTGYEGEFDLDFEFSGRKLVLLEP